jgi:D-alanyl-D-alanine carboxypeptidase (penicillin-binding protein 5/6)
MNRRARKLGLEHTHFDNPIGLDGPGNYSSARDLVTLATVLRTNSFFKKIVDSPSGTLKTGAHRARFANRNTLVRKFDYVNGVKTGHTRGAGYVLVGSASRNGIQLVSAVLATPSEAARDADTIRALQVGLPALPARPRRDRGPDDGHGRDPLSKRREAQARPRPHDPADRPARPPRRGEPQGRRPERRRWADSQRPAARQGRGAPGRQGGGHGRADRPSRGPGGQHGTTHEGGRGEAQWLIIGVALAVLVATVLLMARRRARISRRRRPRQTSAA